MARQLRIVTERPAAFDARDLSLDEVLRRLGDCAREAAVLRIRLAQLMAPVGPPPSQATKGDKLLTAKEVAERLGTTVDWVYARQRKLGAVRLDAATLRFSESRLAEYIKAGTVQKI